MNPSAYLVTIGVLSLQTLGGVLLWLAVRRGTALMWTELVGMGLAIGTFMSMVSAMALANTPMDDFAWLVPAVAMMIISAVAWRRGAFAGTQVTANAPQAVAAAIGIATGTVAVALNWTRIPLASPVNPNVPDLSFFEALARGLAEFGPSESVLMVGGQLRYHWFTYGWSGELSQITGDVPFSVLTRVLPLVSVLGVTLLAAAWAGQMSRVRWVPTLAVLLVVVAGYAGALYGSILNFDSPSQSLTTVWLLALTVSVMHALRAPRVTLALAVVALLAAATTGGKVPHAVVAGAGLAAIALVTVISQRRLRTRAVAVTVVAALAMSITYLVVIYGAAVDRNLTESVAVKASTWQGLDPMTGTVGVALGTLALVLAVLVRLAGVGPLLMSAKWRGRPEVIYACGSVAAGLLALLALRDGINELWFVLAASAPAAVVSAVGSGHGLSRMRRATGLFRRPLAAAFVVAVPATAACLVLSANWPDAPTLANWLAPLSVWVVGAGVAAVVTPSPRTIATVALVMLAGLPLVAVGTRVQSAWTSTRPVTTETGTVQPSVGQEGAPRGAEAPYPAVLAASAWANQNIPSDAIIATDPPVSSLVPALTGRRMYVAGILYQVGLGRASEADVAIQRGEDSESLTTTPSAEALGRMCAAGVEWLWVNSEDGDRLRDIASQVYSSDGVTILRLTEQACA